MNLIKIILLFCLLTQTGQTQPDLESQIADSVRMYFSRVMQLDPDKVQFTQLSIPAVPASVKENVFIQISSQRTSPKLGFQTVWVNFCENRRPVQKIAVSLSVSVYKKVFVAAKKIARNEILAPELVSVEERLIDRNSGQLTDEGQSIYNYESTQVINAGEIITSRMIRNPPLVRRGQFVTLQIRSGHVTLNAEGIAKKDGVLGQKIPVEHSGTGKRVFALVESEGLVVLDKESSL